jgi:hypothetical protein
VLEDHGDAHFILVAKLLFELQYGQDHLNKRVWTQTSTEWFVKRFEAQKLLEDKR